MTQRPFASSSHYPRHLLLVKPEEKIPGIHFASFIKTPKSTLQFFKKVGVNTQQLPLGRIVYMHYPAGKLYLQPDTLPYREAALADTPAITNRAVRSILSSLQSKEFELYTSGRDLSEILDNVTLTYLDKTVLKAVSNQIGHYNLLAGIPLLSRKYRESAFQQFPWVARELAFDIKVLPENLWVPLFK
jgi:hypothetical protein